MDQRQGKLTLWERNHEGREGEYRMEFWGRPNGGGMLVLLSAKPENTGPLVSHVIERLATQVVRLYGGPPASYLFLSVEKTGVCDLVTFLWHLSGEATRPSWTRLPDLTPQVLRLALGEAQISEREEKRDDE